MSLSAVCLVHCLVVPVTVSLLPALPLSGLLHDLAHPVLTVLILPTVVLAVRRARHDKAIIRLLGGGFTLILAAWIVAHEWLGPVWETGLTLAGSVLLIWGHARNFRHHQVCKNPNHEHHHPAP